MQNQAFKAYLENRILNASPEQLQLMLYEGAIRFATVAKIGLEERNYEKSHVAFERVDAIVSELQNGLRPDQNPELCDKFSSLYNFVSRKLLEANFTHNSSTVDDALHILKHLRETWVQVLEKIASERAAAAQADNSGESLAVES